MLQFFLLILLFSGCSHSSKRDAWMEESGKLKVVATTTQIGFIVREVGGERVDTWVLIRGGLDPHSYQLVKGDGERLEKAALVFANGLGLEHGASLSAWVESSEKAVRVGDQIRERARDRILERGGRTDPHIWMDISLWSEAIEPVRAALSRQDPEGAKLYEERAQALREKMQAVHLELRSKMLSLPSERRYLITSHDAFHYFTRSYLAEEGEEGWQERSAAPEGLAPEGQISPVDLREVLVYLKKHPVGVLFPETNVSRDSIKRIVSAGREEGLQVMICEEPLYGDAMEEDYLDSMRHNVEVIARYLRGTP